MKLFFIRSSGHHKPLDAHDDRFDIHVRRLGSPIQLEAKSESEDGESEGEGGEAGESEAGESEAGSKSDSGESLCNFPDDESTAELCKGRSVVGTLFGRAGDMLGVWITYLRFDPAEGTAMDYIMRGDLVKTPTVDRAVLVRILQGSKAGGNRSGAPQQACYLCLLYSLPDGNWLHATIPNVSPLEPAERAVAALQHSIESELSEFRPMPG